MGTDTHNHHDFGLDRSRIGLDVGGGGEFCLGLFRFRIGDLIVDLPESIEHFLGAMRAGLRFVSASPAMRATILRACVFFFFTAAIWGLLPLVVRQELGLGPESYGLMLGVMGVGAVSAGFALFRDSPAGEICNTRVDVFDGSRRSRLELGAPKPGADGEISCAGRYARIEGEAHTMSARQDHGFRLVFRAADDGLARLERIEAPTGFGTAVAERRR